MIESFINIVHPNQDKIIVYNASFEKSVLKEMGVLYPDLQNKINNIIERIEDLMAFIKKNFYHPLHYPKILSCQHKLICLEQ